MDAIVAVSESWGIGRANRLLFSIPEDMAHFREKTRAAALIMGRSTLESLPGGRPLKGRVSIVMSTKPDFAPEGVLVARDLGEALALAADSGRERVLVIGGESVYALLLPYCERAFVTRVRAEAEADRFFPDLDAEPNWRLSEKGEEREYAGLRYSFYTYVNLSVRGCTR